MDITQKKLKFMERALELAKNGMLEGNGGPFGCVIVKDNKIIGEGCNSVTSTSDPTAHAEVVAIRNACHSLGHFQLSGCELYTSCEPCPMCLGAIYWARPDRIFFANDKYDAAKAGFDDAFIYEELQTEYGERSIPMQKIDLEQAFEPFELWAQKEDKTIY